MGSYSICTGIIALYYQESLPGTVVFLCFWWEYFSGVSEAASSHSAGPTPRPALGAAGETWPDDVGMESAWLLGGRLKGRLGLDRPQGAGPCGVGGLSRQGCGCDPDSRRKWKEESRDPQARSQEDAGLLAWGAATKCHQCCQLLPMPPPSCKSLLCAQRLHGLVAVMEDAHTTPVTQGESRRTAFGPGSIRL